MVYICSVVGVPAGFNQYRTDKVVRFENKPRLLPFFVLLATTSPKISFLFYPPQPHTLKDPYKRRQ